MFSICSDIRLGCPPGRSEATLYQRSGLTLIDLSTRLASRGDTMKHIACLILLTSLFTLNAFADDDKDHHHHEDLTAAQLGTVTFPVSCAPSVQKPFERGVALLHSFWNEPDAKVIGRGLDEVNQAKNLAEQPPNKATPREHAYISAISAFYRDSEKSDHAVRAKAYSDAMRVTFQAFPNDHEAAAFYALSLLASERHDDPTC